MRHESTWRPGRDELDYMTGGAGPKPYWRMSCDHTESTTWSNHKTWRNFTETYSKISLDAYDLNSLYIKQSIDNHQIWCQRNQSHMFHLTIQFISKFIYSLRLRPYLTKIFQSTSFKNIIPLILIKIALTTNKFTQKYDESTQSATTSAKFGLKARNWHGNGRGRRAARDGHRVVAL